MIKLIFLFLFVLTIHSYVMGIENYNYVDTVSSYRYIKIKPKKLIPDYVKIQYAGLIGFVSVGVGYENFKRYEPTIFYGILNERFGGSTEPVHTVSIKNSWIIINPSLIPFFNFKSGISVNIGFTNNTFHRLPPHYPEKYYFQNRIHLAPFIGGELYTNHFEESLLNSLGLYFEFSALDAYILEYVRTDYVTLSKIINVAFGTTLYIF